MKILKAACFLVLAVLSAACGCTYTDTASAKQVAEVEVTTAVMPPSLPPVIQVPDTAWVRLPKMPKSLEFAGEPVPLHYFDVYESLQRELSILCYWHATMSYILRLSGRWFPIIEPILKEEGVPDDFKYLCVAESSLQDVVSPAGAAGFWQFMKGTAKDQGLEQSDQVDERFHLEKATRAACRYLKASYAKYESWTLAAAAYNTGEKNVDKRVENQGEISYYNLHFVPETARYVFRILAFKCLMPQPEKYGYKLRPEDYLEPYECKEVTVNKTIESLGDFAHRHGTNFKILRLLNPWLRDYKLTVKGHKQYTIKVPAKDAYRTRKLQNR